MAKEIYYTIENGEKKLTWIARDTETKEVVKEFTDMIEGLKFVNKNENTEETIWKVKQHIMGK